MHATSHMTPSLSTGSNSRLQRQSWGERFLSAWWGRYVFGVRPSHQIDMCMYVCIYIYVCVYIYIHTYIIIEIQVPMWNILLDMKWIGSCTQNICGSVGAWADTNSSCPDVAIQHIQVCRRQLRRSPDVFWFMLPGDQKIPRALKWHLRFPLVVMFNQTWTYCAT